MITPLLHAKTEANLTSYLKSPSQGIILVGDDGIGKYHLALWLSDQLQSDQITVEVQDDKQLISIDQIKPLYTQTRTGKQLVIIIRDAHLMSRDAQNAFLKLLEEPPEHTLFILTAKSDRALLQTITSRSQLITVVPPTESTITDYLYNNDLTLIPQNELLPLIKTTAGHLGSLIQLLSDTEQNSSHSALVSDAKQFYSADTYKRLQIALDNGFDKTWAKRMLSILAIILETLLPASASDQTRLQKIQHQADMVEDCAKALSVSGSPRAHLTRLAVLL